MFTYVITIKIAKALTQISAFSTYAFVMSQRGLKHRCLRLIDIDKDNHVDVIYLGEAFEDEPQ